MVGQTLLPFFLAYLAAWVVLPFLIATFMSSEFGRGIRKKPILLIGFFVLASLVGDLVLLRLTERFAVGVSDLFTDDAALVARFLTDANLRGFTGAHGTSASAFVAGLFGGHWVGIAVAALGLPLGLLLRPWNPFFVPLTVVAGCIGGLLQDRVTLGKFEEWWAFLFGVACGAGLLTYSLLFVREVPPTPDDLRWISIYAFGHGLSLWCIAVILKAEYRIRNEWERMRLALLSDRIHPHFMGNALTTIIAIHSSDPDRVPGLLKHLKNFVTTSFLDLERLIPLRKELELLRPYIELQRARFPEVPISFDVPDRALDCLVPPLLLQPLIENSVKHGGRPLMVNVEATTTADELVLRVTDNGIGAPIEIVKMLQKADLGGLAGMGVKALGTTSVRERLRFLHPAGQVRFQTTFLNGFKVEIRIKRSVREKIEIPGQTTVLYVDPTRPSLISPVPVVYLVIVVPYAGRWAIFEGDAREPAAQFDNQHKAFSHGIMMARDSPARSARVELRDAQGNVICEEQFRGG